MNTENLKIGDLVETCQMLPGFVTEIDGDNVSVFIPGKHEHWSGGSHSITHCGVHKISEKYAMMLYTLGEERLRNLWDYGVSTGLTWEELVEEEYNELKQTQKHRTWDLDELIDKCIKDSGYCTRESDKVYVVHALERLIKKYQIKENK